MKIGRNDPCPCGSGKKYKKCCMSPAAKVSDELGDLMADRKFNTIEEAQAFADNHMRQRNQMPSDDFSGLSPEQMYQILNLPFDCSDLVFFPDSIKTLPNAPLQQLFDLIISAIGTDGLKATAKGNLPQKFCRESALIFWGKDQLQEKTRFGGINKEDDFVEMNVTRLVAERAGFVTKRKGKFHLTKKFHNLQKKNPLAIYPTLFRTYVREFNWGYWDRYEDTHFIQQSFVYSLYLLNLFGGKKRSASFYEDKFLQAFPAILSEFQETSYTTPEESFRRCFTYRTITRFMQFLGLTELEKIPTDLPYRYEFRLKKLPLLNEIVKFPLDSTHIQNADLP